MYICCVWTILKVIAVLISLVSSGLQVSQSSQLLLHLFLFSLTATGTQRFYSSSLAKLLTKVMTLLLHLYSELYSNMADLIIGHAYCNLSILMCGKVANVPTVRADFFWTGNKRTSRMWFFVCLLNSSCTSYTDSSEDAVLKKLSAME